MVRWMQRMPTGPIGADITMPTISPLNTNCSVELNSIQNCRGSIVTANIALFYEKLDKLGKYFRSAHINLVRLFFYAWMRLSISEGLIGEYSFSLGAFGLVFGLVLGFWEFVFIIGREDVVVVEAFSTLSIYKGSNLIWYIQGFWLFVLYSNKKM